MKKNKFTSDKLYFIADIGANHNGSLEKAIDLIHLAKEAGATAAKFQNFVADKIVSDYGFKNLNGKNSHQSKWKKSVYDVYKDASIAQSWTSKLKNECQKVGIEYFTSPYDFESVEHVDPFVDIYKIGSGDISWLEMIEYILKKNKPVLIATGASSKMDVERAMNIINKYDNEVVLMQCNTNYTASLENFKYVNLNVLKYYKSQYPNYTLGLSDHTPGHSTVLGALALGARVFEKHFTDNNNQEGPDHEFAMNPSTWKEMVERSNELFYALGDGEKKIEENELDSFKVQRRCICVNNNYKKGDIIEKENLIPLRPIIENSFHPFEEEKLIGKKLLKDLNKGEAITNDIII